MIATLTIRPANDEDVRAIWRVHAAAIQATCAGHYRQEVIAAWLERLKPDSYRGVVKRGGVVVAEENGEAVGFGQIDLPNAEIQAVYVAPGAQRQGVGTALLTHLERLAARAGFPRLTLKATLNAEPFYASHGWRTVGRDLHKITEDIGLKCVAMEKSLSPDSSQ